ncbi:acyltransferase [Eubacteriaceae bacterium ES3]|nr:acyltransferase [Eubacteriaceae bacterium ES3]
MSKRIYYLDNLRWMTVILVIVFHSAASYSTSVDFWPFHDVNTNSGLDIFLFLSDVFLMALMFYIAGYFAVPSIKQKNKRDFMVGKLKRLGIPWLIITVIVMPILDYIHYIVNGSKELGFLEFWSSGMKKIAEFHFGFIDMTTYNNITEVFYQRYVWFISLLLLFFGVFTFLYKEKSELSVDSRKQMLRKLLLTTVVMIVLFGIVRFTYPEFMDSGWFSLGNIFQFQLGKIFIYAACFLLGIFAFNGKWIESFGLGKPWIWLIACFCMFGINMLVLKNLTEPENPALIFKFLFIVLYPIWTLIFSGMFLSFAYRFWNTAGAFSKSMAKNSYNMYLVHYLVPYTFPLMIANLQIPALAKFTIVSMTAIVFSYLVSRLMTVLAHKLKERKVFK